jgi:hypothetical protein
LIKRKSGRAAASTVRDDPVDALVGSDVGDEVVDDGGETSR